MDSIRVTAKTVEEAITQASIELGTSSDNIEYKVVDEGSKGFFGLGGRKAVIEAKKKFTDEDLMKEVFGDMNGKPEKPKKEPKKEFKKEASAPAKETSEAGKESKKESRDFKKEPKKEFRKEKNRDFAKESGDFREKKEAKKEFRKPAFEEKKAAEVKAEPKKEAAPENLKAAEKAVAEVKDAQAVSEPKTLRVPADPEEAKRRAVTFLTDMFQVMEMKVEIKAEFEEDTLSVDLTGDDMGLLIGKRGQTLDSLQYLTSLVVNKGKASYVRVKLDTEDYRNRRKATLENLAKNIAFKVKKTKRPVFLEPMNPYERRIIHSALQNDPYVTTHSEGDEPCRKVVVTPRRRNDRPERSERPERAERSERSERSSAPRAEYAKAEYNKEL